MMRDDYWAEDSQYPVADWQLEVANNLTRHGYAEWVDVKRFQVVIDPPLEGTL